MRWLIVLVFILGLVGLIVAQCAGPVRSNPKVVPALTIQARMQVPEDVQSVFHRACRDCHTNTTQWPWYGAIAPASWLMKADVYAGREHMNLSEWGKYPPAEQDDLLEHICRMVTRGKMPLWYYQYLHWPSAYLSGEEVNRICAWTKDARARLKREHPDLKEGEGDGHEH